MTTLNIRYSHNPVGSAERDEVAVWARSFAHYLARVPATPDSGSKTGRPAVDEALEAILMNQFIDLGPDVEELDESDWVAMLTGTDRPPGISPLLLLVCVLYSPALSDARRRLSVLTALQDTKPTPMCLGIFLILCAAFRKHAAEQGWRIAHDWVRAFIDGASRDKRHPCHKLAKGTGAEHQKRPEYRVGLPLNPQTTA